MSQYCFVIVNNAGHSWGTQSGLEPEEAKDPKISTLAQLLAEGWVPIRETPMGGGTSQLAHSLVLLEKNTIQPKTAKPKPGRSAKAK
jgi:hypothetical protein